MRTSCLAIVLSALLVGVALGQVTSISGTVYSIDGTPLPGVTVWYNDWETVTDESGNYSLPEASSVPDPLVTPPPGSTSWGRVKAGFRSAPTHLAASRPLPTTRDYDPGPGFLDFGAAGHWSAWHDLTGQGGAVSFNASLPDSVGAGYGQVLLPDHFMYIWHVQNSFPSYMRLISYRSPDLPIKVDGDMNSQGDWDLVQASVDRLNAVLQGVVGGPALEVSPGNGFPDQGPPQRQGIYIYHASNENRGTPVENDAQDPQYLIGGYVRLMLSSFLEPSGRYLDHELLYRLQNYNSYGLQDTWAGIFRTSPSALNDFNREHLRLLRQLVLQREAAQNDLIAFDYVRCYFP